MSEHNSEEKHKNVPELEAHSTLEHILHNDAMGAIILLVSATAAFIIANTESITILGTGINEWYKWLWHAYLGLSIHHIEVAKPLHLWINDGLMAIFFFMVGLEIKRELLVGELASIRKALLPIIAALGGMVVPAGLYAIINLGGEGMNGWGIPMATDIAFAVGVLGLMSKRVPQTMAVFLIALAIVDDLGAVMVIAIFYTEQIAMQPLVIGLILIAASAGMARLGVRSSAVYTLMFILIWITFMNTGVHATIAGVLYAFTIPVDARYVTPLFISRTKQLLTRFDEAEDHVNPKLVNNRQQRLVRAIEAECLHVEAPLQRIINKLHPFCAFLIMPIFAFANAGVVVDFGSIGDLIFQKVTIGIIVGLFVGKQVGVFLFSYVTVKMGLAELPSGMRWSQVYALSCLAAIGFTMSLFISELAFKPGGAHGGTAHAAVVHAATTEEGAAHSEDHGADDHDDHAHGDGAHADEGHGDDHHGAANAQHLSEAKVGTFLASILAGVWGSIMLYWSTKGVKPEETASDH